MKKIKMKYIAAVFAMLIAVAGIGCATHRDSAARDLNPRLLKDVELHSGNLFSIDKKRPTVAVVLGGGGLRGFAHIGVLQALEEAGIKPDMVVGTSAGAVVGSAYASGMSPAQLNDAAKKLDVSSLIDWTLDAGGLMRGENISTWVNTATGNTPMETFPIRFAAVATDLETQQAVLIDKGLAGYAVQASAAVPGINVPIPYASGYLIDGGSTSLVPVRFARAMGADVVIAVDIYCHAPPPAKKVASPAVIFRVMQAQSCLVAAPEMAEADVLIAPSVSVSGVSAKDQQEEAVIAGYRAAKMALPQVLTSVSQEKNAASKSWAALSGQ